jgi:hypothetical protein
MIRTSSIRSGSGLLSAAVAGALLLAATLAVAGELAPQVVSVRDRWAEGNDHTPKKQREAAFEWLA